MTQQYSIRDLAEEFDITTRTIRFYEEKQLLNPAREGQSRIFSNADRTRLKLILRGKRLGLSLEESSDIIAMYDPATNNKKQIQALIDRIRRKRIQLEQQQRDLALMLHDLRDSEERCLLALGGTTR